MILGGGQAACHVRPRGPQVVRRPGGDGGLDREAVSAESGHDEAGLPRAARRDLAGRRASNERRGA